MDAPDCRCGRCAPSPARDQCSTCGEEIRFGTRDGQTGFWHRGPVDHMPKHGHLSYPPLGVDERIQVEPPDPLQDAVIEVYAHPVEYTEFKAQSGLRQIANLVTGEARVSPTTGKPSKAKNAVPACPGWELVNITHARGPYRGSKGEVLSVSDTHVLRARGPVQLDGSRRVAVGSWRDLAFDFAYIGIVADGQLTGLRKVGSDEMKDWIKGHDLPDPVQQPRE